MENVVKRRAWQVCLAVLAALASGAPLGAEPVSLMQVALFQNGQSGAASASAGSLFRTPGAPLIAVRASPAEVSGASLFAGRGAGGMFALVRPRAEGGGGVSARPAARNAVAQTSLSQQRVMRIRALIGWAEAGPDGYDAVQWGARVKPPKRPTEMTLGEVFAWIEATPGQPHAIGYYQFIPATLARLVTRLDLGPDVRFTPALQDRLGDILLAEAGLPALEAGRIDRVTFMNNLAKIWAGLPNSSGKSHYQGIAGNAASISWEAFDREMARIFSG